MAVILYYGPKYILLNKKSLFEIKKGGGEGVVTISVTVRYLGGGRIKTMTNCITVRNKYMTS